MNFFPFQPSLYEETANENLSLLTMGIPKLLSTTLAAWFILFFTIINQSFSARNLDKPSTNHDDHDHHAHIALSFCMPYVFNVKHSSYRPPTTKMNGPLPFSKPLGFIPPMGGLPLNSPNPNSLIPELPSQTLDLEGISMTFPAMATLQELELGTVTTINADVYEGSIFGSSLLGKAQGIFVASSENGSSHMMALTASFTENEYKDGLRFFGVHRGDASESHIAVIGGTGKYENANGYATVETVNASSGNTQGGDRQEPYQLLLFKVYLG